ncbi:RRP7 domain containing protein, partial [Asbolus verrucosus]
FLVVPICFESDSSSHHELFIKEHSVRNYDENKPAGRTLFVINIPPYSNEDSLKKIFSTSVVDDVKEEKAKNGFKIGYIVFEKREGLLKSLKLEHLNPFSSDKEPVLIGLNKWVQEYNSSVYDHEKLSEEVNKLLKNNQVKEKKSNEKQEDVDDDGWTVVTKKGRNPGLSRKESVQNKIIKKNKLKSRKKELKNFYTFQLKEQKMKNIIALRKSFQDSKEKVNLMKKMRNFKPL